MTLRLVFLVTVLAACGDDGGGGGGIDAPMMGSDAPPVDGPPGTACTGAAFDPCTSNTQCMSQNCHLFMQDGFQVCTVACTPGNNATCPVDKNGVNGTCNNMGICKPSAANACTR